MKLVWNIIFLILWCYMSMAELTPTRFIPREDEIEAHLLQAAVTPKARSRATIRRLSGGRDQVQLPKADDEVLQVFGTQVTTPSITQKRRSASRPQLTSTTASALPPVAKSSNESIWTFSVTSAFQSSLQDEKNFPALRRALQSHLFWERADETSISFDTSTPLRYYQSVQTTTPRGIPDGPRLPYSFEELHLLRRVSPNALMDEVVLVAKRLIIGTYQRYCSTPHLINGPVLLLKCMEYYLMADPMAIQNLDQFGFTKGLHPPYTYQTFPQPRHDELDDQASMTPVTTMAWIDYEDEEDPNSVRVPVTGKTTPPSSLYQRRPEYR